MATYLELSNMLDNDYARRRVKVALMIKARNLAAEPEPSDPPISGEPTMAVWRVRQAMSTRIMKTLDRAVNLAYTHVQQNATTQLLLAILEPTPTNEAQVDTALQTLIDDHVESVLLA